MKKIYATKPNTPLVSQPRSFRRLVKQMFAVILKRQSAGYQDGFQKEVMQKLQDIEEMITRQMSRQVNRGK